MIEGSPTEKTLRAIETAVCLSLTTEEFLSLLSENVEIAQGIFRLMIERRGALRAHTIMHGSIPPSLRARIEGGALQPVDTILLLQKMGRAAIHVLDWDVAEPFDLFVKRRLSRSPAWLRAFGR